MISVTSRTIDNSPMVLVRDGEIDRGYFINIKTVQIPINRRN